MEKKNRVVDVRHVYVNFRMWMLENAISHNNRIRHVRTRKNESHERHELTKNKDMVRMLHTN